MSTTHEISHRHDTVKPGSDRGFAMTIGTVLLAFGGYRYLVEDMYGLWILGIGVAFLITGLVYPRILHPLNIAWSRFGVVLGRIVSPVVMLLVFYCVVVPTGLLLRAMGKDLLGLKDRPDAQSYWIVRAPPGPAPESLKDQF